MAVSYSSLNKNVEELKKRQALSGGKTSIASLVSTTGPYSQEEINRRTAYNNGVKLGLVRTSYDTYTKYVPTTPATSSPNKSAVTVRVIETTTNTKTGKVVDTTTHTIGYDSFNAYTADKKNMPANKEVDGYKITYSLSDPIISNTPTPITDASLILRRATPRQLLEMHRTGKTYDEVSRLPLSDAPLTAEEETEYRIAVKRKLEEGTPIGDARKNMDEAYAAYVGYLTKYPEQKESDEAKRLHTDFSNAVEYFKKLSDYKDLITSKAYENYDFKELQEGLGGSIYEIAKCFSDPDYVREFPVEKLTRDNLDYYLMGQEAGVIVPVFVTDEKGICTSSRLGVYEVSREHVPNISKNTTMLFYDKATCKFYEVVVEDDHAANLREQKEGWASQVNAVVKELEGEQFAQVMEAGALAQQLEPLLPKIETHTATETEWQMYHTLVRQYKKLTETTDYETSLNKYNDLYESLVKYQEMYDIYDKDYTDYIGEGIIAATPDWGAQLWIQSLHVEDAREQYLEYMDKYGKYYNAYDDYTEINSIGDGVKSLVGKWGSAQWWKENWEFTEGLGILRPVATPFYALLSPVIDDVFWQGICESLIWETFAQPIWGTISGDITVGEGLSIFGNNIITQFGEVFDTLNFIKPIIVGASAWGNEEAISQSPILENAAKHSSNAWEMGMNVFAAWSSQYDGTDKSPVNVDYIWLAGDDANTLDWIAALAADIILDPANWFSFGGASIAREASSELSEGMSPRIAKALANMTDDAGTPLLKELSEEQIQLAVYRAGKHSIKHGTDYLDDIAVQLAKIEGAAGELNLRTLLKSLPDHKITDVLGQFIDGAEVWARSKTYTLRHPFAAGAKKAITRRVIKSADFNKAMLADAYEIIAKGASKYKALNYLDEVMFGAVTFPLKPVAHIAKKITKKLVSISGNAIKNAVFHKRIIEKTKHLFDETGNLIASKVDEYINIVETELKGIGDDVYNNVRNTVHREVRNHIVDAQLNSILDAMDSVDDAALRKPGAAADALNKLNTAIKAMGTEKLPINCLEQYLYLLKKPMGDAGHSIYDMLDSKVISKLRTLQTEYNRLVRIRALDELGVLIKGVDDWRRITQQSLEAFYKNISSGVDSLDVAYTELANIAKQFESSERLIVEGYTNITKADIQRAVKELGHELNNLVEAAANGKALDKTLVTTKVDDLHTLFNTYVNDVHDIYARVYLPYVDSKVERAIIKPAIQKAGKEIYDAFIDSFSNAIKNKYGVELTKEQITTQVLTKLTPDACTDSIKFKDATRVYTLMPEKFSKALAYISDASIAEQLIPFIDNTGIITGALDTLGHVPSSVGADVTKLLTVAQQDAITLNLTTRLFQHVADLDIDAALKTGILDALSGEQHYINSVFRGVDKTDTVAVSQAVDRITNHVIDKAAQYLSGKDGSYGVKLFSPVLDSARVRMCSLDSAKNVENILNNLELFPGASRYLAEDSEEYLDVVFSLSRVSDESVPFSITFSHNGETVTFKNKQTKYEPTDDYVRNNHGMSLSEAKEEFKGLNIFEGLSRAELDEAIGNKLLEYKELASKSNKKIRFIGYNNGIMGTHQDETLRMYIAKNALPVHNDLTIDLADFLSVDAGLPVMTSCARGQVHDGIRKYFNISAVQGTCDLLATFDETFFTTLPLLENALVASKKPLLSVMTNSYYESIVNAVANLRGAVNNISESISSTMSPLTDVCIKEKVLTDLLNELLPSAHLTGINVHALLEEAYKYAGLDYALNAYKLIDSAKYSYLFDLDKLSGLVKVKHLETLRNVSNEMLGTIARIKQPEVLTEVGAQAYKDLLTELLKDKTIKTFLRGGRTDLRVIAHALDNTKADEFIYFSACRYIFTTSAFKDPAEFIKLMQQKGNQDLLNALYTVRYANEAIFNSGGGSFTHAHRMLESKVYGELNDYAEVLVENIDTRAYTNISEYISRKTETYAKHNFVSAAEQISLDRFKEIAEPYMAFVKSADVVALPPSAFNTRLEYVQHLHKVSEQVSEIKASIRMFGDMHREAAMRTVFYLPEEDFFTYLVKHCKNTLVIDVNCKPMKDVDTRSIVFNKLNELKESGKYIVDEGEDGIIKVFYHTGNLKDTNMDEFYFTLSKRSVDYNEEYFKHRAQVGRRVLNTFLDGASDEKIQAVKELLEHYLHTETMLAKNMSDNWIISTFTVNTQETAKHLQDIFPEAARFNVDDMNQYGLFNDAFTCSVWADGPVIRNNDLIQYYSDDVVKSMGDGLYHVRNNLEAVNNKFALYNNERMSLGYIVEHSQFPLRDYTHLNKILEHDGLVLHRGVTDEIGKLHVERVTVNSNAELAEVLSDKSVIISPYDVYSDMVQFCKSENYKLKVDSMLSDSRNMYEVLSYALSEQRTAFATGALFLRPGTWVKNYPDSVIKMLLNTGDSAVLPYYLRAKTLLDTYEEVFAKVTKEYHMCGAHEIAKFFKEFPEQTCGLSLDTMFKIYAFKTSPSAGNMAGTVINLQNTAVYNKLLGLCADTPEITEEVLQDVIRVYHKEARKANVHPGRDFIKHKNNVRAALEAKGYGGELLDKFTELYYSYTASSSAMTDFLYNSPSLLALLKVTKAPDMSTMGKISASKSGLSNYITFNSNMFSAAEDRVRLAMHLYYTDELGHSAARASTEVVKTQFDYNARPALLDALEGVFPFITFSLYNTKYWLFDAPKQSGGIRAMVKATTATESYYDSKELINIMRGEMLRDKLASGELATNDDGTIDYEDSPSSVWAAFAHTILGEDGVVEEYQGQLRREAQLMGSIPLGNNHVLKFGNTFLDALDFASMVTYAVPQVLRGEVPDLLKEKVYTPIRVALGAFKHYSEHGFNQASLNKWVEENWYDIIASVPFYGSLVNNAITHMKNGNLNLKDLWVIASNPQLKDELLHSIVEHFYCVAGAFVPSIVGTVYEDDYFSRPIGYDWYNQDEEYRKTHRYVWGVSYVPAWLTKNPGTYVNYLGKYMALGYTRDEAMKILNTLFGDNPDAPVKWGFDQELFDETLAQLVQEGYSLEEAITLLSDKALWNTDELSKQLGAITQQQAMENSVFYKMYGMLPDYIKYTDGQYGQLMSHYRSLGYSEEQAWAAMWTGTGFIDPTGAYKVLATEQVALMNKEVNDAYAEFMLKLPGWYKYEPGAATRAVKYLKEKYGMNTEQARDYIVANNFYVTEDEKPVYYTDEESVAKIQQSNKEFKEYYSTLPDYIKYESGAFSRTLKYLTSLGYSSDTAKELIKDGAYLTLDGELIDCTGLTRKKQYNTLLINKYGKAYRLYVPRPKSNKKRFVRLTHTRRPYKMRSNNSLTYSLVNVRNGSNFGTRNSYKVTLGYNSASAILSTKGSYPQVWRNIAQSYRRNLYKEHYAKYGMSRIDMRSGVWKGYSNASVTRLRRENLYAARRYRNRRVF